METFCNLASSESREQSEPHYRTTAPPLSTCRWLFLMVPLLLLTASCGKDEKVKQESQLKQFIESRSTGDCAENAFLNWFNFCNNSTPIVTKTRTFSNLPGYPANCTFTVQYSMKMCVLPVVDEIHVLIGNFKIIAINCPQYHDDIYNITYNPGIGIPTLADYLNNLFDMLTRKAEDAEFLETLPNFNLDCSQLTAFYKYVTNYYEESCFTYCVPYGQRPNEFEPPLKISCGEECCRTEVFMCYDYINSKIVKDIQKSPLFEGNPDCTPLQNLANICLNYSGCLVNCE